MPFNTLIKIVLLSMLFAACYYPAIGQTEGTGNLPAYYDVKSCKVTYKMFNGIQQGVKTVVFDNYGREEKMIASTAMSGNISNTERNAGDTTHEMILKKEGFLYKINLSDGTGFKLSRTETLPLNLESLRPGQVITGTDTFLGHPCVIVEVFGSLRTWYWNRIPIKKQVIGSGMTTKIEEYAIAIEENYTPGKGEFEIPEGIRIK